MCRTQVQLSVVQGELDAALKQQRRAAAENAALQARVGCFEAASRDSQQALERARADLAFCGNVEKQQLWSALSESKRRLVPLQVCLQPLYTQSSCSMCTHLALKGP